MGSFGFEFFWGDDTTGAKAFCMTSSGRLREKLKGEFIWFFFLKDLPVKFRIFNVLDWLSSVCGWQVMAKKQII